MERPRSRLRCVAAGGDSFNCISVDGHMSTNDTVLLLANGAAGGRPLAGRDLEIFQKNAERNCDGAGHMPYRLTARGNASDYHRNLGLRRSPGGLGDGQDRGQQPAGENGDSGADPNWGRMVSAAGYAGCLRSRPG